MRPDLEALRLNSEVEVPQNIKEDLIKFTESGRPYLALVDDCIKKELGVVFSIENKEPLVSIMPLNQAYPGQNFKIERQGQNGIQFSIEPMDHFNHIAGKYDTTYDYPKVEMKEATNESLCKVIRDKVKNDPIRIQAEKETMDRLIVTKVGIGSFYGAQRKIGTYNDPVHIADIHRFIKAVYTCRKELRMLQQLIKNQTNEAGLPRDVAGEVGEYAVGLNIKPQGIAGRKTRRRIHKRKPKGTKRRKYGRQYKK